MNTHPAPVTVPVVLLDVDGVINAISRRGDPTVWPRSAWRSTTIETDGETLPVLAAQPVLDFLTALHTSGAAEIRWHTTWQHTAATDLAPKLGLPQFAVAHCPEFDEHSTSGYSGYTAPRPKWWKFPAAERVVLEERRRLVWLDDDIEWERHRRDDDEVATLIEHTDRVLAIAPREHIGLTRKHLTQIAEFLGVTEMLAA